MTRLRALSCLDLAFILLCLAVAVIAAVAVGHGLGWW